MAALLWRALIAVIVVALLFALIPPLLTVLGVSVSAALLSVLKICIGGIALLYVLKGPPFPV